jgi:hypothetical protein
LPHAEEKERRNIARNRAELDAVLAMPMGKQAAAEEALIRELGGGT